MQQAPERYEPVPNRESPGEFAAKLNALIDRWQGQHDKTLSNEQLRRELDRRGCRISSPYLSQLRRGIRTEPSAKVIATLTTFFEVEDDYFTAGPELGSSQWNEALAAKLSGTALRRLVRTSAALSSDSIKRLSTLAALLQISEAARDSQERPDDREVPAMNRHIPRGFDADRFDAIRRRESVSIADLARRSGVGVTTVYGWCTGISRPQIHLLHRVAAVLEVGMDEILDLPADTRTLTEYRWLAGLIQSQVAWTLGMRTDAFAQIERGRTRLSEERAQHLAALYRTTADEIHAAWKRAEQSGTGDRPR
ncbi:helix-turn-helix domain-containing protein [Nocardia brasiliensis]|uniref:helix-turn-helix domain-containing protein n=1 Tax=Nocardia brasiliensis TaxID=37326 RepID=UPI001894CB5A|nr:helix-turn-helix transcriptional regulator [Nocardia brasiliensis]MBF6547043.1 helix-turn-helix domain-containing protein [Nocardia brasiliensis]